MLWRHTDRLCRSSTRVSIEAMPTRLMALRDHPAVRTIVADAQPSGEEPSPTLLATTVPELLDARDALLVECFGPTSLVVEYATDEELLAAADAFGGQLAAGVHGEETDPIPPSAAGAAGRSGGAGVLEQLAHRCVGDRGDAARRPVSRYDRPAPHLGGPRRRGAVPAAGVLSSRCLTICCP